MIIWTFLLSREISSVSLFDCFPHRPVSPSNRLVLERDRILENQALDPFASVVLALLFGFYHHIFKGIDFGLQRYEEFGLAVGFDREGAYHRAPHTEDADALYFHAARQGVGRVFR